MTSTSNLTIILMVILAIDVIFLFGQTAITELNPTGTQFYDYDNSFIKDFDTSGNHTLNENVSLVFPDAEEGVSDTGSAFTDVFKTGKSWFLDVTGLSYLLTFLGAPIIFLSMIPAIPTVLIFGIGVFWYGMVLFLLISFLLGRS